MNVSLRKQKLKDGRESLFLDYYLPKAKQTRKKESLKLYLYSNPKSKLEREHNKKVSLLAESIRSKRLLELQHEEHEFSHLIRNDHTNSDRNFIPFFKELTKKKNNQLASHGSWNSTLKFLIEYTGNKPIKIKDINEEWVEGFKDFLLSTKAIKKGKFLSKNTCHVYFSKLKASLNEACRAKLIPHNPCNNVKQIKPEETEREFLTLDELKEVAKTECSIPILKQAFLFSALTGIRKSDIMQMKWKQIQYAKEHGWYVRFTQKKTKATETLPISDQAKELLGTAGNPETLVFQGFKYNGATSLKIQLWTAKAGITKKITFHCARHTFATLQLTMGTDIYTLSKLLGHKVLRTTQIYGKIIDKKKIEAVNRIPNLSI